MSWFFIIVPVYNAEQWIGSCLDSIQKQDYSNYKVVVIDDCSSDGTWKIIQKYPFIKYQNESHNGSVIQNMVKAFEISKPDLEDIDMVIDGDDPGFADDHVLKYLDEVYKEYVWFTYGQFEPISGEYKNFCKSIKNSDTYRKHEEWSISQLRTWKHWLWKHVYDCDLRDSQGRYFMASGDRAFSYPMIEMAGTHIRFIEKVLYIYNDLNPLNEFRVRPNESSETANYIINKPEYKRL